MFSLNTHCICINVISNVIVLPRRFWYFEVTLNVELNVGGLTVHAHRYV